MDLGITDLRAGASCGCGGGACSCGHGSSAGAEQAFEVVGLSSGADAAAVTEELAALGGVERVVVEPEAGGVATVRVRADRALTRAEVEAAVADAGCALAR